MLRVKILYVVIVCIVAGFGCSESNVAEKMARHKTAAQLSCIIIPANPQPGPRSDC